MGDGVPLLIIPTISVPTQLEDKPRPANAPCWQIAALSEDCDDKQLLPAA